MNQVLFLLSILIVLASSQTTWILSSVDTACAKPQSALIYTSTCANFGNSSSVSATCSVSGTNTTYTQKMCTVPNCGCTTSTTLAGTCTANTAKSSYTNLQCGGTLNGGVVQTYSDSACSLLPSVSLIFLAGPCFPVNGTSWNYACSGNNFVRNTFTTVDCSGTAVPTTMFSTTCAATTLGGFAKMKGCGIYDGVNFVGGLPSAKSSTGTNPGPTPSKLPGPNKSTSNASKIILTFVAMVLLGLFL